MARKNKTASKTQALDPQHPIHHLNTLGDYMDLMQRPARLAWLNFWAGVWRGFGMAVGTIVLFAVILWGLKYALHHAGGLPWVGDKVEEFIAWLLNVIDKRQNG